MPTPKPYQVIKDATASLYARLLAAAQPGGLLEGVNIEVAVPDDKYNPKLPALTLYLFRVVENTHLRNRDRIRRPDPAAADDPARYLEMEPPMGIDLFYLLVPWAKTITDEHELLGRALQFMYGNRIVPPTRLEGYLREEEMALSLQLLTDTELSLGDMSNLWDTLNRPFKLCVAYRVRGVRVESPVEYPSGRVLEKVTVYQPQ